MTYPTGDLSHFVGATVPDFVPRDLRLLIVGINPGLVTAATNVHFGKRGNKFYPALVAAGILPRLPLLDGTPTDAQHLLERAHIGITNLVAFATRNEKALTRDQFRAGGVELALTVRRLRPPVVAVLAIGGYEKAFDLRGVQRGEQVGGFEGARLWVLPNPSPANPEQPDALAKAYAEPARAAGIIP